jgi:gluconolactonase
MTIDQDAIDRRWAGAPPRYPDPAVVTLDPRFEPLRLFNAAVEHLWTGARWAEGPVWFGDQRALVFSDIANDRLLRYDDVTGTVSEFRRPSGNANGNTRDRRGRLVTCEHLDRRVTRTEYDGSITVLADSFDAHRLNAPNDVIVMSDEAVWFTDPGYGILNDYEGRKAEPELETAVYRIDPDTGDVEAMVDDLERPNGLCVSPDETRLYVVDSGSTPRRILAYELTQQRISGAGWAFSETEPWGYDGIRCDVQGNVWAGASGGAGNDGVHVLAPDGERIGQILLPEICANIAFGGANGNRLFMAASTSLYALYVGVRGA